jgi:Fic family protein
MLMEKLLAQIEAKKRRLDAQKAILINSTSSLFAWIKIELTYTSNALEGNTLSRAETAQVVEKGLTIEGKTIREHLEAVSHAEAFEWVAKQAFETKTAITELQILKLHRLILQKIDLESAGRYRTVPVRIAGYRSILPNPLKVPALMQELGQWLKQVPENPVTQAAQAHYKLVSIHPFADGNGRTARLLMNWLLLSSGYPPAIIGKGERLAYLASLEKAQLGGSLADYYQLVYNAVNRSLDLYLQTSEEQSTKATIAQKKALKIGELAKLTGESVPTIRHWTKSGLLEVVGYTRGGYQLYDSNQRAVIHKIHSLQKIKRLTLLEIKRELQQ